jgi:hypothetical protein
MQQQCSKSKSAILSLHDIWCERTCCSHAVACIADKVCDVQVGDSSPGCLIKQRNLSNLPAQPSATEHAQVAELRRQLEAGRREVAGLHARLADVERQRDNAREQLAVERALRVQQAAESSGAAARNQQLEESWKGLADELKQQLKVRDEPWLICCHLQQQ